MCLAFLGRARTAEHRRCEPTRTSTVIGALAALTSGMTCSVVGTRMLPHCETKRGTKRELGGMQKGNRDNWTLLCS